MIGGRIRALERSPAFDDIRESFAVPVLLDYSRFHAIATVDSAGSTGSNVPSLWI
jgi:hypothetical protein